MRHDGDGLSRGQSGQFRKVEHRGDKTTYSVSIEPDDDGYLGRECPVEECLGYFKITPGTGLSGEGLPCHCPYCGHTGGHDTFWTREQIAYARSVVLRDAHGEIHRMLKRLEVNRPPRGPFGIGFSVKVTGGRPEPIRYYAEKDLETEVVCRDCGLRYTIYGVFGFCPDCGVHNSMQILGSNLDMVEKILAKAQEGEPDSVEWQLADVLSRLVAVFDGFGREACRISAPLAADPAAALRVSFQSLAGARKHIQQQFGFDIGAAVTTDDWELAFRHFHRRHLLAHRLGVVDADYVKATGDPDAVVGRKVVIRADELAQVIAALRQLGAYLVQNLPQPAASAPADGDE